MKKYLKILAERIPLPFYRTIIKRDLLGFYYHVVSNDHLPHIKYLYDYKSLKQFENDLIYLKKSFNLISYENLEDFYYGMRKLGPRSVILTFDDGFSECYSVARPLLLKYEIPCVFFITTDYIDNKAMSADLKASLCLEHITSLNVKSHQTFINSVNSIFTKQFSTILEIKTWILNIKSISPLIIDKP